MSLFRRFRPLCLALCVLPVAASAAAQTLPDPILPGGRVRLEVEGWFSTAYEQGFDPATRLGSVLTRPSAAELFPGTDGLRERLGEALAGDPSPFPLRLGASVATATENLTRLPFAVSLGVLDWLTVGVMVPMVRARVEGAFETLPDPDADLGLNPGLTNLALVSGFVSSLGSRGDEVQALADDRCGAAPGSQGCLDAQALADDLTGARGAFAALYGGSFLFPVTGTPVGDALLARVDDLEARLGAQGLDGLADLPLAGAVADAGALNDLLTDPGGPYRYVAGPGTLGNIWELGDVEAHVAVRLLEGQRRDSAGTSVELLWRVAAVGGVRLGTAPTRLTNTLLLPRGDDGQTDLFAGAYGGLATGRLALRAQAFYTRQQAGEVQDRVRAPDEPFAPSASLARLEWDPGDELEVEVQPALRLAPALSLSLIWRYWRHAPDVYTRLDPLPAAPTEQDPLAPAVPVRTDASLLALGTERSHHELGGGLTYRTTQLPDAGGDGFEVFAEVRHAVSGTGAYTRAATRLAFGGRLLWRLWGR
jgi:hypothetical protein